MSEWPQHPEWSGPPPPPPFELDFDPDDFDPADYDPADYDPADYDQADYDLADYDQADYDYDLEDLYMPLQPVAGPAYPPGPSAAAPPPEEPVAEVAGAELPKADNPREVRNKAEKQRRDKLNHSIATLASMVPPVRNAARRVDKTGVLRLTAHYIRAHQYVFGDSARRPDFSSASVLSLLGLMNGFLLTTTYRGLVVVVSPNVQNYLGYTEIDLLGHNIASITHPDDVAMLAEYLKPNPSLLGANGELLVPEDPLNMQKLKDTLAADKKRFVVRFKKMAQRSEPAQYVPCHVEGSLRKADRACKGYNRCCQMVRRARSRNETAGNSGNDVVFVGMVRPNIETIVTERSMESSLMEYRTRHSIDGEIIQCDQKISLVAGYMTHEVQGLNAMTFMHRDDVRWVVIALREMYDQRRMLGESAYRLMAKNGQFIYMRTRGHLEVNPVSGEAKTFVCTNSIIDEKEWKHVVEKMKSKFSVSHAEIIEPSTSANDNDEEVSVEDPEQLQEVILQMVTNLPSPETAVMSPLGSPCSQPQISLIPHHRDRIVNSIGKIYDVINIPFTRNRNRSPGVKISELPQIPEEPAQQISPEYQTLAFHEPKYQTLSFQKSEYEALEYPIPVYHDPLPQKPGLQIIDCQKPEYQPKEYQKVDYTKVEYERSTKRVNTYKATALRCPVKISDQVLASVQLEPGASHVFLAKRPNEVDEEDVPTRKRARDMPQSKIDDEEQKLIPQEICDSVVDILEGTGLEAHLENTLNSIQTLDGAGEYEDFPDILNFFNFDGDQDGDEVPHA